MAHSIVVNLDQGDYRRLTDRAIANDRDPWQEARHLIRAAISQPATQQTPASTGREEAQHA